MLQPNKNIQSPYLPARELLDEYLTEVYSNGWLTNNGPLVQRLEERLADFLDVPYVVAVANGTLALQLAVRLLDLSGEVITTPLSFVATANAMQWEGIVPRFADVFKDDFLIDPSKVESLINPSTRAILPVHLFGRACDVEQLDWIAKRNNLRLLYDAAQAFGLKVAGQSILMHGDISVLSFHATKIFHTVEGGALILHTPGQYERALELRAHGRGTHNHGKASLGTNAKLSEVHAAFGLSVLDEFGKVQTNLAKLRHLYYQRLCQIPGLKVFDHSASDDVTSGYMPILCESSQMRYALEEKLSSNGILVRRYFDPPLHRLQHFASQDQCPNADALSKRLVLLPMPHNNGEAVALQACKLVEEAVVSSLTIANQPQFSV